MQPRKIAAVSSVIARSPLPGGKFDMSIVDWLSTTSWAPFGPSPIDAPGVGLGLAAGRIEAAAPHPSAVDVMFVAGNNGGVWKTGVWTNDPPVWLVFGDGEESLNFAGYHPL